MYLNCGSPAGQLLSSGWRPPRLDYNVIRMNMNAVQGGEACTEQFARQLHREHAGEYAYAYVHCDPTHGEIYRETDQRRFFLPGAAAVTTRSSQQLGALVHLPPSLTVYRMTSGATGLLGSGSAHVYACYPALPGTQFAWQAVQHLVATEVQLNRGAVKEWNGFVRHKLKKLKLTYGLLEAYRWLLAYRAQLPEEAGWFPTLVAQVQAQNVCIIAGTLAFAGDVATSSCIMNGQNTSLCTLRSLLLGSNQCQVDADCDDGNACTLDLCQLNRVCRHVAVAGCCLVPATDCLSPPTACHQSPGVCVNFTGSTQQGCYYPEKDADGDGVLCSADCNDADPAVGYELFYPVDEDGDGFGKLGTSGVWSCGPLPPAGYAFPGLMDCNDWNGTAFYGALSWPRLDTNAASQVFPQVGVSATMNAGAQYGQVFDYVSSTRLLLAVGAPFFEATGPTANAGAVEILWRPNSAPETPFQPLASPNVGLIKPASPTVNEAFGRGLVLPRQDMLVVSTSITRKLYAYFNTQTNSTLEPTFLLDATFQPQFNTTAGVVGTQMAASNLYFVAAGVDLDVSLASVPTVWVMRREATGTAGDFAGTYHNYTLVQTLTRPAGTDVGTNNFGSAVAVDATGGVLAVGNTGCTPALPATALGCVYLYTFNSTSFRYDYALRLTPPDTTLSGQGFGNSLSLSSTVLLVGASSTGANAGAVFGYHYQKSGTSGNFTLLENMSNAPSLQGFYPPLDRAAGIGFGFNVRVDESTLAGNDGVSHFAVVGRTNGGTNNTNSGTCGAFYAYLVAGSAWHQVGDFALRQDPALGIYCNATVNPLFGQEAAHWSEYATAPAPLTRVDTFIANAPALDTGRLFIYSQQQRHTVC